MMQAPISQPPQRSSIVMPILLILLGFAFLGQELGLIDVSIWTLLWRLWPVWLIAMGLDLMLGRRTANGSWIILGVVVAIVIVVAGLGGPFSLRTAGLGDPVAVSQPLGGAKRAEVLIDASVSRLQITSGGIDTLVEGTITPLEWERIEQDERISGDKLVYELKSQGQGQVLPVNTNGPSTWDLQLSDRVPMELRIDAGVGESRIDIAQVQLTSLKLDTGVGETEVVLPGQGRYKVEVDSGVGSVTLRLPRGLAARIHADQGIGAVRVDGAFERESKSSYISPNFSQAENRAEIEIDGGVGEIVIETY